MVPAFIATKLMPYRWVAIGIVAAALLATIAVQSIRLESARADLAEEKRDRAVVEKQWADAWIRAQDEVLDNQVAHAAATMENADALNQANQARAVAERGSDALSISLRDAISAAVSFGSAPAGSDAAACQRARNSAAALGDVLQEARGLVDELTKAAEKHADGVRFWMKQDQADREACGPPIAQQ